MFEGLLSNFQGTVVFIIVLGILIVVHEWGHFITAKLLGVRVEEFALGFGQTLWSKVHNGTKYMVKLIPLGGYVKMFGDERAKCTGDSQEFYSKPVGHRALIVLNGPIVNFILAYVCLVFVFILGYPDLSSKVGGVIENYPAAASGVMVGDKIVKINNVPIEGWSHLQKVVSSAQSQSLDLEIIRNDQPMRINVLTKLDNSKNIFGQMKETKIIGIRPAEEIVTFKYDVITSLRKSYEKIIEITVLTYKSIYFMITGSMSAKESMTGPVGIFLIVKSAAEMGFTHVLLILGLISASLAIFNLLPIIPLDGGHLALLLIEKVRGKALAAKIDDFIMRVGFSLIIALAIFVFYSDFARLGWIDKVTSFFHKPTTTIQAPLENDQNSNNGGE